MYDYDDTDLNAVVESVDENSMYWHKETVTFDAAYGGERVIVHLYLPRKATPPYQTVVYFPAAAGLALAFGSAGFFAATSSASFTAAFLTGLAFLAAPISVISIREYP